VIRRAAARCSSSCRRTHAFRSAGSTAHRRPSSSPTTATSQLLTHPSHGVEKEYLAEVEGIPTPAELRRLREGVELDDGPTRPAQVRMVQEASDRTSALVAIVVKEGRKRMVRRMCSAVGHPVRRLVRTRIGPLRDSKLAPSAWRELTATEVRSLYAAALGEGAVLGKDEDPAD
jgi:23S rRNA pseudouridine2605 synthase